MSSWHKEAAEAERRVSIDCFVDVAKKTINNAIARLVQCDS